MEAKDSIVVVADSPTCTGFRLAGVQKAFFGLGKEAETKINELIALPDVGIIVVNENIIDSLDWRLKKKIERLAKPVIIAVPDKGGPSEQAASLKSMIKRALGFELLK